MPDGLGESGPIVGRPIALIQVPNQRAFRSRAAAQYLGINDDTLHKYTRDGLIPARQLNGHRVYLLIGNNQSLADVDGLSSLTSVGGDVSLTTNSALARCCGLFPLLNVGGVAGEVILTENVDGCNSVQDILDGGPCFVAVGETTWGNMKRSYR